jgi:hypothetical protein
MSNQDAKTIARAVVADLLRQHPPGLVIMILRQLKIILRSTKDITTYEHPTPTSPKENRTAKP